ncbi:50S ribosomal protein L23 [Candidatus Parcubacteria bacterium]|nr:50S ribosomal protein L23 [Candidatus Parcubacteria bacterium]
MKWFSKKDKDEKKQEEKSVKADIEKKDEKKQSMKDLYEEGQAEKVRKTAKTDKSEKSDEKKKIKKYGNAYKVLVKPLITEKATNLGAENKYVFEVSTQANKIEIAKAINEVYGIKPVNVNIVKMKGKKIRSGKTLGRRKDWKKAIIQLPEGKTIKVYEGV